jgi:hypothetical protein
MLLGAYSVPTSAQDETTQPVVQKITGSIQPGAAIQTLANA